MSGYDRPDSIGSELKDLQRRVRTLETSPRSSLTQAGSGGWQFSQDTSAVEGTRTPAGSWGDLDPGGPGAPSVSLVPTPRGQVLVYWGCRAGVRTGTSGGASEAVGMDIDVSGVHTAGDCPAELRLSVASTTLYASISNGVVLAGLTPGAPVQIRTKFLHDNALALGNFISRPWLWAVPR